MDVYNENKAILDSMPKKKIKIPWYLEKVNSDKMTGIEAVGVFMLVAILCGGTVVCYKRYKASSFPFKPKNRDLNQNTLVNAKVSHKKQIVEVRNELQSQEVPILVPDLTIAYDFDNS